jgi:hypothetical protein
VLQCFHSTRITAGKASETQLHLRTMGSTEMRFRLSQASISQRYSERCFCRVCRVQGFHSHNDEEAMLLQSNSGVAEMPALVDRLFSLWILND